MAVFAEGCNRGVLAEERVAVDEPGSSDRFAFGVGEGRPDAVNNWSRFWKAGPGVGPAGLALLRQLRVLRAEALRVPVRGDANVRAILPMGQLKKTVEDPRGTKGWALDSVDWTVRSRRKVGDLLEMRPEDAAQGTLDRLNQDPQTRLLTADEMAEYADRNRSWPSESAREGRLISVRHDGETYYPAFQIDPVQRESWYWVSTMARILESEEITGRSFTLWAAIPSPRFGHDTPATHTGDSDFMAKAAADLAEL